MIKRGGCVSQSTRSRQYGGGRSTVLSKRVSLTDCPWISRRDFLLLGAIVEEMKRISSDSEVFGLARRIRRYVLTDNADIEGWIKVVEETFLTVRQLHWLE